MVDLTRLSRMAARVLAAWLVLAPASALADDDDGFVWEAPAQCPDAADVRARIERRLGAPVDNSVRGIAVVIAPSGDDFVARIEARGAPANQVRTLSSARCDDLADAVAVIVARLATEAQLREAERRAPPVPAPPEERRRGPGRWGGGVRGGAVSGIGALPGVNVGGEVALYARRASYFAELAGARWARSTAYLMQGAPAGVEIGLTTAALRVGWSSPRTYLRAWLGAEFGAISGDDVALADAQSRWHGWIAPVGGVGVAWPLIEHVRIVGSFEAFVPIRRTQFELADESRDLYRAAAAGARCALGLEVGWQ